MSEEEEILNTEWIGGKDIYVAPEYVPGSRPVDNEDGVTWCFGPGWEPKHLS